MIPSCLYTDGQVFDNRKESYFAVVTDQNNVLYFCSIGYKPVRETEGSAILKALEYFQENNIINGTIYTDSMDWVGIVNGKHRINATTERNAEAFFLYLKIMELKEELLTTIHWKRRTFNLAGIFLGEVWHKKKHERNAILTTIMLPNQPNPDVNIET